MSLLLLLTSVKYTYFLATYTLLPTSIVVCTMKAPTLTSILFPINAMEEVAAAPTAMFATMNRDWA